MNARSMFSVALAVSFIEIGGGIVAAQVSPDASKGPAAFPAGGDGKAVQAPAYVSSLAVGATPKITANQAQIAALTANPGAVASTAELEDENGQLVYAVPLNTGAVVKVDAGNGKVLYTDLSGSRDWRRREAAGVEEANGGHWFDGKEKGGPDSENGGDAEAD